MPRKLIIISYRLPYKFNVSGGELKVVSSSGGLATALLSFFERVKLEESQFDSFHWVGISDISKKKFEQVSSEAPIHDNGLTLHPVFIEGQDSDHFYNGFCNSVLWPLFHYFPSYVVYEQQYFDAYVRANEKMKDAILALYAPGDVVWVHDYHFMLLPALLRAAQPAITIGFFLHIPFPSFELFRILPKPWRMGILEGILGANVVGFHTDDYVHYFKESVERMLKLTDDENGRFNFNGHITQVKEFPISIDVEKFQEACALSVVKKDVQKIRARFGNSKLILSVDRLDYTKAIINRLESFELFLQQNPDYKEKVTYILLLVPSRDTIQKYRDNKREVETLIGRINGLYGSISWTPLIYQYRSVDFKKLTALYNASDIALIAPVRDGMNLVAKEFIACRTDLSGVLILSETAGCSSELPDAILVNPNDRHEIANSILQAVLQPMHEQQARMRTMQEHIRQHDVKRWVSEFMQQLLKP